MGERTAAAAPRFAAEHSLQRQLGFLDTELAEVDRVIALAAIGWPELARLMTAPGSPAPSRQPVHDACRRCSLGVDITPWEGILMSCHQHQTSDGARHAARAGGRPADRASSVLRLQRKVGNRAVQRLLAGSGRAPGRRLARDFVGDLVDEARRSAPSTFGVKASAIFDPAGSDATFPGTDWPVHRMAYGFGGSDMASEQEANVLVKAGTTGKLTIWVYSEIEQAGDTSPASSAKMTWNVTVTKTGAIALERARTGPRLHNDRLFGGARIALSEVAVGEENPAGAAFMGVKYTGTGSSTTREKTTKDTGWHVGTPENLDLKVFKVPLPKIELGSEGDETMSGETQTGPTPVETRGFLVHVVPTDVEKPPPPPPRAQPPRRLPDRRNEWSVRFPSGDGVVNADEREKLYRWYATLQPETKHRIEAGEAVLSLESYADTTRKVTGNDTLADQRATAVEDALKRQVGRKVQWSHNAAPGEAPYATDDPRKEVKEVALRRSVIAVVEPGTMNVPGPDALKVTEEEARRQAETEAAIKRQLERNARTLPPRP